eukprot:m.124234 g.124234  ORF g.124234 m.124234 type:complete len:426 (-) comp22069_c0_seq1:30-1307(-)
MSMMLMVVVVTAATMVTAQLNGAPPSAVSMLRSTSTDVLQQWAMSAPCSNQADPFCGSSCNCTRFCAGECAINATLPENRTLYRMTMKGVYNYNEKNTGDKTGDLSFVLGTRLRAYACRQDPNNALCNAVAKFSGDDPNSTDLVLEVQMEVDGQWGPYLLCNPKNTSDSTGPWACTTSLNFSSGLPLPPSCTDVYIAIPGYAWNFAGKVTVLPADTLAKCCALAEKLKIPLWQFFEGNSSCVIGTQMDPKEPNGPHHDGVMAYAKSLVPPPCDCPRVHMTVGRENLTRTYGGNSGDVDPVGGDWFSHPTGGQCAQGAPLGTAGCTWRVIDTKRVIKASCMYETVDAAVEKLGAACFNACPQPTNHTSTCYLGCFTKVVKSTSPVVLTASWDAAFETCPPVSLPPTAATAVAGANSERRSEYASEI